MMDQPDAFYRFRAEYDRARADEKLLIALITKLRAQAAAEVADALKRMQETCVHPSSYDEGMLTRNAETGNEREVVQTFCEACGKLLRESVNEREVV